MNRKQVFAATAVGLALGAAWTATLILSSVGQSQQSVQVPKFQYDPTFPQPLPEKWAIGAIGGMAVDSHDHIWVLHRPGPLQKNERFAGAAMTPPRADCCIPAPPVLEFDENGNFVQGWGGPGEGYDWPEIEHGIYVDPKGFVWLGGNGKTDNHLVKFTKSGKFVMQIGRKGQSKGNKDTQNVNQAADTFVYAKTNELFVADGYGNSRIIVFDADTGAFKRMWGAFGKEPDTLPARPKVAEASRIPPGWHAWMHHRVDDDFVPNHE